MKHHSGSSTLVHKTSNEQYHYKFEDLKAKFATQKDLKIPNQKYLSYVKVFCHLQSYNFLYVEEGLQYRLTIL